MTCRLLPARSHKQGAAAIVAAALLFAVPVAIHGHDPGLSSLEIHIGQERIVATLSLATSDARLAADAGTNRDTSAPPATSVSAFVLKAIDLRIDGVRVNGAIERSVVAADSGARVVVAFARRSGTTLTIRSAVPASLSHGHRQLLTIRAEDERRLDERMLTAEANQCDLALRALERKTGMARQFLSLGVSHILGGYDHLLFLAALLLAQRRLGDVVKTITAFTVAHSLTLGASVLGVVDMPTWLVEPVIAMSIVVVGLENLIRDRDRIGSRWKVTFAFGLVHGFGFAGALQDLGIGGTGLGIVTALASFNLGVEAGQVAAAVVLWPAIQRLNTASAVRLRLAPVCSVLVVIMGAYWLVERTLSW